MNKGLIIASSIFVLIAVLLLIKNRTSVQPTPPPTSSSQQQSIHYHAGFQVYRDGQLQDYSGLEHMKIEPCYEGDRGQLTAEEEQLEKAHLHDSIGDVVHVHRAHATWSDLFSNANIQLDSDFTAYLNGEKVDDLLQAEIKSYDSVVIFEGSNTNVEEKLSRAVTKDHIVEVENLSESCGS